MAVPNWFPLWNGGNGTTTGNTATSHVYVCASCNGQYPAGSTHLCGPAGSMTSGLTPSSIYNPVMTTVSYQQAVYRPHITKLRITGTAVILEDEYGNGLEIALDVLRRLMNFSEVEAFAALDALRR